VDSATEAAIVLRPRGDSLVLLLLRDLIDW